MRAPSDTASRRKWYLIQCKPRQDERAREHLERQLYTCYQPRHRVERVIRGRRQMAEEVLFPGYLFIHLDDSNDSWLPIRSTRGVLRLVTFGQQPLAVADQLVEQLKSRTEQASPLSALPAPGARVRINAGSFQDVEAIFLAADGTERVLVLLQLLQRQHRISVPLDSIHPS
ncbi:Transcription antitermination protein RfaH [compost metagenome]